MSKTETPLMTQWREMKKKHPDAVLLFRVGEFYETFNEDAVFAHEVLGITLTRHNNGKVDTIKFAGFPKHALDGYIPKLVRAGKRVAICEQLEDNKPTVQSGGEPQPKPTKKMKQTPKHKDVNILMTSDQICDMADKEQMVADFSFDVPKAMKNAGKQAGKDRARPALTQICIEPASGKAIVSDTHILSTFDIDCKGFWPGEQSGPFRCYIHPKAISAMAGKRCDISVYANEQVKLTISETEGCLCHSNAKDNYPNWQRVIPAEGNVVKIKDGEADKLREYLKDKCGKYKPGEWRPTRAIIELDRANEVVIVTVQVVNPETDSYENVSEPGKFAYVNNGQCDVKLAVNAPLLEMAVAADWAGEMVLIDYNRPVKFIGTERISIIMPIQITD